MLHIRPNRNTNKMGQDFLDLQYTVLASTWAAMPVLHNIPGLIPIVNILLGLSLHQGEYWAHGLLSGWRRPPGICIPPKCIHFARFYLTLVMSRYSQNSLNKGYQLWWCDCPIGERKITIKKANLQKYSLEKGVAPNTGQKHKLYSIYFA